MGLIHVLDPHLTNMIAAGEVVDRPVNIVKECVENSLDAGASSIDIEVFEGGIAGVVVTDDGCGMSYDDARTAFRRHATSKLKNEEELFAIATMGFRGEALPSIASVAKVVCTTSDGKEGTRIEFEYGDLKSWDHIDAPQGTRIEVTGLFLHTPARFKYLKKPNYEFSVIADAVNKLSLAHPEVRFTLRHDNRLVFQTSGRSDRREILYQMFGMVPSREAVEFFRQSDDFTISGYAMQPSVTRASKNYIYICLNGRTIRSWPITKAVIEGYREYMPKDRYPICFIEIETDFQLVDVNVHPNKLEVRISKEEYLTQLIIDTIHELFEEEIQVPQIVSSKPNAEQLQAELVYPKKRETEPDEEKIQMPVSQTRPGYPQGLEPNRVEDIFGRKQSSTPKPSAPITSLGQNDRTKNPAFSGRDQKSENQISAPKPQNPTFLKENLADPAKSLIADQQTGNEWWNTSSNSQPQAMAAPVKPAQSTTPIKAPVNGGQNFRPAERPVNNPNFPSEPVNYPAGQVPKHKANEFFLNLKIIGQLKESYILCEGPDGLVIIDQHAAAERANFEKIQKEFEKPVTVTQPLMIPLQLTIPTDLMANLDCLNEKTAFYGLKFVKVDDHTIELQEEPSWMSLVDPEKTLDDLFTWFQQHQIVDIKELRRHMIATCACHSSVRFNHALNKDQMECIIEDLVQCDQPFHCPHGRPTVISLTLKELAKEFERV